ncbi:MAG: hypothetical protein ABH840_00100 [Nanoarchaeota archaeon]
METPREYVERISSRMEHKKGKLDEMFAKYETLMESDRIYAVPANDSVYNSPEASSQLKQAIKTRKLDGMTQEDFENEYKRVLHGIKSSEPQTETTAITKAENQDIVPTSIDKITAIEAGHTQDYLVKKCREYGITRAQLADMIHMKAKYHTVFPTMLRIIDKGYSLDEAAELLETRDLCVGDENAPSLVKVMALQRRFNLPVDSDILNPAVEMIRERVETFRSGDEDYVDSAISALLHNSQKIG